MTTGHRNTVPVLVFVSSEYGVPVVVTSSTGIHTISGSSCSNIYTKFNRGQLTRFDPVRLNCGGPRYVDPDTKFEWKADSSTSYVTTGSQTSKCNISSVNFANTTNSMREIYCSSRFFQPSDSKKIDRYTIPVLNTTDSYIVRLHFGEMEYRLPNERKMDVLINGKLHLDDFDIVAKAGFQTALVYQTPNPIKVTKGQIRIQFMPVLRNAIVSGIEVLKAPPSTTSRPTKGPAIRPSKTPTKAPVSNAPTKGPTKRPTFRPTKSPVTDAPTKVPTRFDPVRLNCGGPRYVDPDTKFEWKADSSTSYVTTGSQTSKCNNSSVNFANTTNSMREIYCSNRFFQPSDSKKIDRYTIPVLNTTDSYIVRLHFGEMEYRLPNERKMDVLINGKLHLADFDIVAKAGFQTALVYQTPNPINVTNGQIRIQFMPVLRNAIISGIEVLKAPPSTTSRPTKVPTRRPSKAPTKAPATDAPTKGPTKRPTFKPTKSPVTDAPTKDPTSRPTKTPTKAPVTDAPTKVPTKRPTFKPTKVPVTNAPTQDPTKAPVTNAPTKDPTKRPTFKPTKSPVTDAPTKNPTSRPSKTPTKAPVTDAPTKVPTKRPTFKPTKVPVTNAPTQDPTKAPVTNAPTKDPTKRPTFKPTKSPVTHAPTKVPTGRPTKTPTKVLTQAPIALTPFVYYRNNDTNTLGVPDVKVAIGNPLKGLAGGPRWSQTSPLPNSVPSAIEFYNIALDEVMVGDNQFNWTLHDRFLSESAGRKMHVVFSVFIDWPGRPLRLPSHLRDLPLYQTSSGGLSPNYGDARLLTALRQFIYAWSDHIDGDTRVAALHVGLLGFWGEGNTYPDNALVPETSKASVAGWYRDAFHFTHIQTRYPGSNAVGFGLYDGSLAYNTLDGAANGGVKVGWFQYPRMVQNGQTNIWKEHMMGGETRPELQSIIFTDTYPARTENHQDYKECIDTLHISYAVHHGAFQNGGYTGNTLRNANQIHAYMGYAFYVSEIAAMTTSMTNVQAVNVVVSITQLGVAPFYYDLSLVLQCANGLVRKSLPGVNTIIQKGDSRTFTFTDVPATSACLGQVTLSLDSSYAYSGRPILFAQGSNGKVQVNIPVPGNPTRFLRMK